MSEFQAFSSLTITTLNSDIKLQALFTAQEFFVSTLDFDYLGNIFNFPNYRSLLIKNHIVALINPHPSEATTLCDFHSFYSPDSTFQLICSSKEDNFSTILIILPASNNYFRLNTSNFEYCLLKFSLEDLLGNSIANYITHIENIDSAVLQIKRKSAECYSEIKASKTAKKAKLIEGKALIGENKTIYDLLQANKQRIIELYVEFERLEKQESECGANLRCAVCCNNLRNVLCLPCGHLVVCDECFMISENAQTEGGSISRKRSYCECCKKVVKETKIVSFKSN